MRHSVNFLFWSVNLIISATIFSAQKTLAESIISVPTNNDNLTINKTECDPLNLTEKQANNIANCQQPKPLKLAQEISQKGEEKPFTPTVKLSGEVIFNFAGVGGGDKAVRSGEVQGKDGKIDGNTILSDRVRLHFDGSFTGKDQLRLRLEARNTIPFDRATTGTNMTRLSYDGSDNNDVKIGKLFYKFPVNDRGNIVVDATGGEYFDNLYTFNPVFQSSGTGAISRFGRFNPIYRQGAGGAGVTFNYKLSDQFDVSLGYLADEANNSGTNTGFFNGSYAGLAQLTYKPNKTTDLGLTYVRAYDRPSFGTTTTNVDVTSGTGSDFARRPFGNGVATSADHLSLQGVTRLSPNFTLSGWAGLSTANAETGPKQKATITNWAIGLGFPDLGQKGNVGGIIFGQPPKVSDNDNASRRETGTSYHLETLYRHQLTDKISITPGFIVIFNPENNDKNATEYVGVVRTTFNF